MTGHERDNVGKGPRVHVRHFVLASNNCRRLRRVSVGIRVRIRKSVQPPCVSSPDP